MKYANKTADFMNNKSEKFDRSQKGVKLKQWKRGINFLIFLSDILEVKMCLKWLKNHEERHSMSTLNFPKTSFFSKLKHQYIY